MHSFVFFFDEWVKLLSMGKFLVVQQHYVAWHDEIKDVLMTVVALCNN